MGLKGLEQNKKGNTHTRMYIYVYVYIPKKT